MIHLRLKAEALVLREDKVAAVKVIRDLTIMMKEGQSRVAVACNHSLQFISLRGEASEKAISGSPFS